MISYEFSQCSLAMLEELLGVQQVLQSESLLPELLRHKEILTDFEREGISSLQQRLETYLYSWNEQELSLNFIGPLLNYIKFGSKKYGLFAERRISAQFTGADGQLFELSGDPDGMVASGFRSPRVPFFCFHAYKPEQQPSGDPAGQALAAILTGRQLNSSNMPIFGCYVVGQNWYFMELSGENYAIASPFAATSDDIFDIFNALRAVRARIEASIQ